MNSRKNRRGRRRRRSGRPGLLISAGAVLLMGSILVSARSPSPQDEAGRSIDLQGIQLAEDIALLAQSSGLPDPAWGAAAPECEPQYTAGPSTTEGWKLTLVNRWTPLPEDWTIRTVELRNGFQVDERCYPDLQEMMDDCRAKGLSPLICSAYRTQEYQERLYQAEVEKWLDRGWSRGRAEEEAGKSVATPGTSEHQLGLAVDIVDMDYQKLDRAQEDTAVQKWLLEHSWEYGFILRYPNGKSEITGIIYEPWHYRYVGREDAARIHALDVCLEEYLEGIF